MRGIARPVAWPVHGHCMAISWPVHGHFMAISSARREQATGHSRAHHEHFVRPLAGHRTSRRSW
eukprot:11180539-Lingulodinium_polyedra.AAC.1